MKLVLGSLLALLASPSHARACAEIGFTQHALDRAQLADTVPPGPVDLSMWIEEPGSGGCTMPAESKCAAASGRRLVLLVSASDDQTPPDRMGYRVTVTAGRAPFPPPGDVRPVDEMVQLPLGDATGYDFELAIRAVDLNGNLGPATYSRIVDPQGGAGCATHHTGGATSLALIAIALGLTTRTARRGTTRAAAGTRSARARATTRSRSGTSSSDPSATRR